MQQPVLEQSDSDPVSKSTLPTPTTNTRRHDIDWLRTIALVFLIIYHCFISFTDVGKFIGFPINETKLELLWIPMSVFNIWRLPILFLISGMGVYFAMRRRNWAKLLGERSLRILVPFVFGIGLSIAIAIVLPLLGWDQPFMPNFLHLWFLGNIYVYVLLMLALFVYLKNHTDSPPIRVLRKCLGLPFGLGLYIFALPFVLEAAWIDPEHYAAFAFTLHGLVIGGVCFFMGFILVASGQPFWQAIERIRWVALAIGVLLFAVRLLVHGLEPDQKIVVSIEALSWMLAVLGFGSKHLNRPSALLSHLNKAVFPIYFLHMPIQFLLSVALLPLAMPALLKLLLLTITTLGLSYLIYILALNQIPWNWLRPWFGVGFKPRQQAQLQSPDRGGQSIPPPA